MIDVCDIQVMKPLLNEHGFHFSKAKGQNFLIQRWVPESIAEKAGVDASAGVLEIGPGIGPLTQQLCLRANKVCAVELDKRLAPTALGEVVTQLMLERFQDIIDVEFTANMENRLDDVEAGKQPWKALLADFYRQFHQEMLEAEAALEGVRLKVPDEVTEEICEVCGRNMVVKVGRFGKFLACPGFPECKNTKPIVEKMPGRCPKCGSTILKRKSKRGFAYFACERGAECGFMSWDVPTAEDCPTCGQTLFKKSGRGRMKPFCVNETCPNFLPEDKRGYYKKPAASVEEAEAAPEAEEKAPAKKAAAKKSAAKKPAAKKAAAKKTGGAKK